MREGVATFIAWTPIRKRYYPYLRENYLQDGRVKAKSVYLGKDIQEAETKLQELELPEKERQRLIEELHRKWPQHPPTTQVEKKAARQLKRIAAWYPESEKVQQAVAAALEILERREKNCAGISENKERIPGGLK